MLIARALTAEPRLLVLDEPTASLDFVRDLAKRGLAVLLSKHDPDQALAVASHALLLKDCGMLAQGEVDETLMGERLTELFGVSVAVAVAAGWRVCVPVRHRGLAGRDIASKSG